MEGRLGKQLHDYIRSVYGEHSAHSEDEVLSNFLNVLDVRKWSLPDGGDPVHDFGVVIFTIAEGVNRQILFHFILVYITQNPLVSIIILAITKQEKTANGILLLSPFQELKS